jgi:hypothetical protein
MKTKLALSAFVAALVLSACGSKTRCRRSIVSRFRRSSSEAVIRFAS